MSDDSPTERFDTASTPPPPEPDKRKSLLVPSLAAIGGVLLILVIILVVALVARGGTGGTVPQSEVGATKTPSATSSLSSSRPSASPSASAKSSPGASSAASGAAVPKFAITAFTASANSVKCVRSGRQNTDENYTGDDAPGIPAAPLPDPITLRWTSVGATSAFIGIDTRDARANPYQQVNSKGSIDVIFACYLASHSYTVTIVGSNGAAVSKTITVTNIGAVD